MGQVMGLEEAQAAVEEARRLKQRVVLANGCFDLLHVGHVRYLESARSLADVLVVGINSDRTVRALKGEGRPIVPAAERAELLAALEPVDFVLIFQGDSPAGVLTELQPEVHCKGTDYGCPEGIPEFEVVREYGGRSVVVGDPKDHATRDLIVAIKRLP